MIGKGAISTIALYYYLALALPVTRTVLNGRFWYAAKYLSSRLPEVQWREEVVRDMTNITRQVPSGWSIYSPDWNHEC